MENNDPFHLADIIEPPMDGPGSSREAWIAHARRVEQANRDLVAYITDQRRTVQQTTPSGSHVAGKRDRIPPKGICWRLPEHRVQRIEQAIAKGGSSTRDIAKVHGVSAMTVSRISRRMKEQQYRKTILQLG